MDMHALMANVIQYIKARGGQCTEESIKRSPFKSLSGREFSFNPS